MIRKLQYAFVFLFLAVFAYLLFMGPDKNDISGATRKKWNTTFSSIGLANIPENAHSTVASGPDEKGSGFFGFKTSKKNLHRWMSESEVLSNAKVKQKSNVDAYLILSQNAKKIALVEINNDTNTAAVSVIPMTSYYWDWPDNKPYPLEKDAGDIFQYMLAFSLEWKK